MQINNTPVVRSFVCIVVYVDRWYLSFHTSLASEDELFPVHFGMLSNQLIRRRPRLLRPSTSPSMTAKTTESGRLFQCPYLLILRRFMVASRPSSSLTFTASRTHTFVLCSVQLICSSRRQVHSSNAEILFSSTNLSVQLSHPYVAMLHTRVFISFFFVLLSFIYFIPAYYV